MLISNPSKRFTITQCFSSKRTDFNLGGVEFRRHVVAELSSAWFGEGVG